MTSTSIGIATYVGCATATLCVAAFRKFLFVRDLAALFDTRQYSLIHFERLFENPLTAQFVHRPAGAI